MHLIPAEATCHAVSLPDLLVSRDERQSRQNVWLIRHEVPLLSFTVVTPGPVKDSVLTRRIFNHGIETLYRLAAKTEWNIREQTSLTSGAGPEALFAIDAAASDIKQTTIALEHTNPLGRLWDIDVFTPEGKLLSRRGLALPVRRCLICERPAAECARGKTHSLPDLLSRMEVLLHDADLIMHN